MAGYTRPNRMMNRINSKTEPDRRRQMLAMNRVNEAEHPRKKRAADEPNINNNIFCLCCTVYTYLLSSRSRTHTQCRTGEREREGKREIERETIKTEMKYRASHKWKREKEKILQYLCVGTMGWRWLGVRRHFCFGFYRFRCAWHTASAHIIAYVRRVPMTTRTLEHT